MKQNYRANSVLLNFAWRQFKQSLEGTNQTQKSDLHLKKKKKKKREICKSELKCLGKYIAEQRYALLASLCCSISRKTDVGQAACGPKSL